MHKYICAFIVTFLSISIIKPATEVPTLEYEQEFEEDLDILIAQTKATTVPGWKIMMQRWGTWMVSYIFWLKRYSIQQYERIKLKLWALWYKKNTVAKKI